MAGKFDWLRFVVSPIEGGGSVVSALEMKLAKLSISKRAIKKALHLGACSLNGKIERFGSVLVKEGDRIAFFLPKLFSTAPIASLKKPLFEDDHLLFFEKPPFLLVDQKVFSDHFGCELFLVHRLDHPTSGVMVAAKTKNMQKKLETLFRKREVEKIYFAVVAGKMGKKSGVIRNFLTQKNSCPNMPFFGETSSSAQGALAITYWHRMRFCSKWTLVQCFPKTGRTHQLRAHLSLLDHPILGDAHYGRFCPAAHRSDRLMLHAYCLRFVHPVAAKMLAIVAPLPPCFSPYMGN